MSTGDLLNGVTGRGGTFLVPGTLLAGLSHKLPEWFPDSPLATLMGVTSLVGGVVSAAGFLISMQTASSALSGARFRVSQIANPHETLRDSCSSRHRSIRKPGLDGTLLCYQQFEENLDSAHM